MGVAMAQLSSRGVAHVLNIHHSVRNAGTHCTHELRRTQKQLDGALTVLRLSPNPLRGAPGPAEDVTTHRYSTGEPADKLYSTANNGSGGNLLDLEELSDGDFLSNVPFSGDHMDDFSSDLFNSFFDDHLLERPVLNDRPSMLHLELDTNPEFEWSFNQDLSSILVKQEEPDVSQPMEAESSEEQRQDRAALWEHSDLSPEDVKPVSIKDEPREMPQYLSVSSDESLQLPPTPQAVTTATATDRYRRRRRRLRDRDEPPELQPPSRRLLCSPRRTSCRAPGR
ncbi:hypothetical protein WMY93_022469 [Mugilogobius chulae]|uniref:Uncharacterized protein n=1 Tax=Mugilogobius chulae TaxID=88201 RepID=A0AAW0NBJ3_9GOBI